MGHEQRLCFLDGLRDGRVCCWVWLHFEMCGGGVCWQGLLCRFGEDSGQDGELGERWMRIVMMILGRDGLSDEGRFVVNKEGHCG